MPILKAEAVVLRRIKYGDTSLIVTLYTLEHGKVKLMAKGARLPKSKFVGALEPACHVTIVYYNKESRELQMLSQIDLVESYPRMISDLRKSTTALAIVDVLDSVIAGEEPNENIFNLIVTTLSALNAGKANVVHLWYFQMALLDLLGFRLDLSNPDGMRAGERLSKNAITVLEEIKGKKPAEVSQPQFTRGTYKEINRFLSKYFSYHVEGTRKPRALKLLDHL